MDATKILEEMDQFKELWNQVTLNLDVLIMFYALYTGIKRNRKWFWLANRNSNCNQATKETAAATTTAELDWPIRS